MIVTILVFSKFPFMYPKYAISEASKKSNEKIETNVDSTLIEPRSSNQSEKQNEVVATLKIPNTDYSTVVTQGGDNEFYLNHDENGNKSLGGVPILDYRVEI